MYTARFSVSCCMIAPGDIVGKEKMASMAIPRQITKRERRIRPLRVSRSEKIHRYYMSDMTLKPFSKVLGTRRDRTSYRSWCGRHILQCGSKWDREVDCLKYNDA